MRHVMVLFDNETIANLLVAASLHIGAPSKKILH